MDGLARLLSRSGCVTDFLVAASPIDSDGFFSGSHCLENASAKDLGGCHLAVMEIY